MDLRRANWKLLVSSLVVWVLVSETVYYILVAHGESVVMYKRTYMYKCTHTHTRYIYI